MTVSALGQPAASELYAMCHPSTTIGRDAICWLDWQPHAVLVFLSRKTTQTIQGNEDDW